MALLCSAVYATDLQILADENRPLSFSENGQTKGLGVEVVQEIQRRVGNKNTIEIQPWARAYRAVSSEPNVAVFAMARTAAREDLFQLVEPISASRASLYGRRGSGRVINNIEDAKSVERIMVVRDFYTRQLLQKLGFTNLELVPKPTVAKCQAALDNMKRDGSYAATYAKWLPGETPTRIKPEPNVSP